MHTCSCSRSAAKTVKACPAREPVGRSTGYLEADTGATEEISHLVRVSPVHARYNKSAVWMRPSDPLGSDRFRDLVRTGA